MNLLLQPVLAVRRSRSSGKERDTESSLDYFGRRYFAASQGRFTSADRKLSSGKPGDPQSWNRYAYVDNNPLEFVDPDGAELRLAPHLDRKTEQRVIRDLARAYRTEVGRSAIEQLAGSVMVHTYGKKSLPSETVMKNGETYVKEVLGRTDPNLKGTTDKNGNPVSVVKDQSSVEVNFDFDKMDKGNNDYLTGKRASPPVSESHVTFHEVGHDLDVDTDPLREHNRSPDGAERVAEDFAARVEGAKKTMSQKDAEKAVRSLLKKEDEKQ